MTQELTFTRRRWLRDGAGLAGAIAAPLLSLPARASQAGARTLSMAHTHTRERIELVYAAEQGYLPEALVALNRFLRDHYSGQIGTMHPPLFDVLHAVRRLLGGAAGTFEIISGYRCPDTNDRLRRTRGGGVAQGSLHLQGQAVDVRLPGVPLAELRDAALSLRAGGVGYYPGEQFVHIDTGRVRSW
jgi:uncharacterized protein YcbK (DUF882 family)